MSDHMMTTAEAAHYARTTRSVIQHACANGLLPHKQQPSGRRNIQISRSDLDGWIKQRDRANDHDLLSCDQAKRFTGISATRIAKACNDGELPHTVETCGKTAKRTYKIRATDLMAWADGPTAPRPVRKWAADDDAAVVEMYYGNACTYAQIGAFIGRSAGSVQHRLTKLGVMDRSSRRTSNRIPFHIPITGIIIARTCVRCGDMRDADHYPTTRGRKSAWCRRCHNADRRAKFRSEPYYAARTAVQTVTKRNAINDGKKYGEAEMRVIADTTRSDLDVALTLRRSLYAIHNKRQSTGNTATAARGPRTASRPAMWRLDLALEERPVLEAYRTLGGVVPEELWEWNDNDAVAS